METGKSVNIGRISELDEKTAQTSINEFSAIPVSQICLISYFWSNILFRIADPALIGV